MPKSRIMFSALIRLLISLLTVFTLSAVANENNTTARMVYDFYQGTELTTPKVPISNSSINNTSINNSSINKPLVTQYTDAFYWLQLPEQAYLNSAYPDSLQDISVFNSEGEEIPFSLFKDSTENSVQTPIKFMLYPVQTQFITNNSVTDNKPQLEINTEKGIWLKVSGAMIEQHSNVNNQAYLLVAQDEKELATPLDQLIINWSTITDNWQAKATVYNSSDKKNWTPLANNVPLMELTSVDGKLISRNIVLNKQAQSAYWLLIIDTDKSQSAPKIMSVNGISQHKNVQARQQVFKFKQTNEGETRNEVTYRLPTEQLISSLKITLQQKNQVLPIKIDYQSHADGPWIHLGNYVVYSLEDNDLQKYGLPITLNNLIIRKIRITALRGGWGEHPPYVSGARDGMNIIFNAQGVAPYLLVWGNINAQNGSLPLTELLASSLTPQQVMAQFNQIEADKDIIELGGSDRLKNKNNLANDTKWQHYILWSILCLGILILGFFCWRLLIDLKRQSPSGD